MQKILKEKINKLGIIKKHYLSFLERHEPLEEFISKVIKIAKYYSIQLRKFIRVLVKNDPENIADKTIKLGVIVFGSFATIFIIWGILAPINSASIAPGKIVLDFNKKTIQHLEGGIVEKILVTEGQMVVTGQSLIYLRDIQTRSENKMLIKQLITSLAIEERLTAQRDQKDPDFSKILARYSLEDHLENEVKNIISTQNNLFNIKKTTHKNKINILYKRIAQLRDESKGIESQKIASDKELEVLKRQQIMTKELVDNNNSPLNKLLEIEKQSASLEGRSGELEASLSKVKQSILETRLEIINLNNEDLNETLAELQDVEVKISDLTQQSLSAKDVLKRSIIKSPTSGTVTELKYHTIGAVIPPGAEIMFVVPNNDEMIVEARVNPTDIDNVKAGLNAKIQLTAFKAKKVPKLLGKVSSISADILLDEATGEQYFLARIRINPEEIARLKENITLYPGMPADAFIITGSRSFFDYLFDPITQSAYKAFRED